MKAYFEELIQSHTPVLFDFFATWCGPCQSMNPVLQQIKSELGDKVRILKIDVDKNTEFAAQMKVMGVPTFMLYKDGRELWRQAGVVTRDSLKKVIENAA